MERIKVLSIFGIRSDTIKMAPILRKLQERPGIESVVCVTAQHREMLDQMLDVFGIKPDYDLNIMKHGQSLNYIASTVISELDNILSEVKPDIVLVHGDPTTAVSAAMAAMNHKIPVGHVEAGLRTYNKMSPFPEELNRTIISLIASLHFAPTEGNKINLIRESITDNIYVTGNTAIDALLSVIKDDYEFRDEKLRAIPIEGKRTIVMDVHRRENLGEPMTSIFNATKKIIEDFSDVQVIFLVHKNPLVQETAYEILGSTGRVYLIDPIEYDDMVNLMNKSYMIMTDSGGLQEEAPALGKPVLVLRTETERPEAVSMGTVKISGVVEVDIYNDAKLLLTDRVAYEKMASAVNPYGDGKASERIVSAIETYFGKITES